MNLTLVFTAEMSRSSPRLAVTKYMQARSSAERRAAHDVLRAKRQKRASQAPYPTPPLTPSPDSLPSPSTESSAGSPERICAKSRTPEIRYTSNKNRGLFSRVVVERGEEILRERPMWLIPADAKPEEMLDLCDLLSEKELLLVWSFTGDGPSTLDRIMNIARTNGIPSGDGMLGLYETMSRINHSCQPNAVWRWDASASCLVLTAWTSIQSGEEITCSYLDELDVTSGTRQLTLFTLFGSDCACTICEEPDEEQYHRDVKIRLYHKIRKLWSDPHDFDPRTKVSQWTRDGSLANECLNAAQEILEDLQLWDALGEVHEERLLLQIAWAEEEALGTARRLREHFAISQGPAIVEKHYGTEPMRTEDFVNWGYARAATQKGACGGGDEGIKKMCKKEH